MNKSANAVVNGRHIQTGQPIQISLNNSLIAGIESLSDTEDLPWIGPGLVDLQVNGYAGFDFNTLSLSSDDICNVALKIAALGVTSFYPTIITNSDHTLEKLLGAIAQACAEHPWLQRILRGIHLEGPFISPEDGVRGAHDIQYVKAPDWEQFQRWQQAAQGMIRVVTLSPEWNSAPAFIAECIRHHIVVSIGHTSATPEQINSAVVAGARMCTHLGNGAHLLLPRHPNYIWEQLAQDELYPCVIADGFHLPDQVLKVFHKVKPDKLMIASDAVSLSGLAPGTYKSFIGGNVVLTTEGRLHMADNPDLLAGSAQMLPYGVEHLVRNNLCGLAEAWAMASTRPASFMKLPEAHGLQVGAPGDLVVFDWHQEQLVIHQVYKDGQPLTSSNGSTFDSQS
ncbi:N-acetylglucosamine-6-phosphate deacetylase [Paenibacillus monticola]|uniref:Amidohydrolase family protein n=1 Tax=Paenibacillus monticola TaxID=2666075 RepID=A0A7X2H775_9BACL|nr:amidohydrolase family protein [Paenibacillus monticola]MRN54784.1 amidohydrolase family protein [Paenibacillus monticola]